MPLLEHVLALVKRGNSQNLKTDTLDFPDRNQHR
jgi:hypothetical protein